jgi:hypothetical protein
MSKSLSKTGRTWFRPWMIASVALFVAGCVTQSGTDAKQSFSYNPMISIGIVLAGLACIPIGFFWRRSDRRLGWGLMTVVPLAALVVAASMAFEHVSVTDQSIEVRSGFFGSTAAQSVPLEQVKRIHIAQESTGGRRARMVDVLYFFGDAGEISRFPLNNDVKIEASRAIIERASARGIPVAER